MLIGTVLLRPIIHFLREYCVNKSRANVTAFSFIFSLSVSIIKLEIFMGLFSNIYIYFLHKKENKIVCKVISYDVCLC